MTTDEDAFEQFFRAAWPRLFRTAYVIAGDHQAAEDAVQVAMVRVCARWSRVRSMASPEAYARRIAVNECLGRRRVPAVRRETPTDLSGSELRELVTPAPDDPPDLWNAVRELPPRQRAVIVLRYYEGLSESEIAEALGCRPGTVKSQASAALARLRTRVRITEGEQA
jgi:RNA polymerase sigma-70 factor (sigma-E family)